MGLPAIAARFTTARWKAVCSLYAVPALVAALLVFLRRDLAGG